MPVAPRPDPGASLPGWTVRRQRTNAAEPGSEDEAASEAVAGELRRLQDLAHASRLTPGAARRVAGLLAAANAVLAAHPADEDHQFAGNQLDLPGRGQTLVPVVDDLTVGDGRVGGRVTYGRFYDGRGYAAHGGTLALLFDDVLGRAAGSVLEERFRTAYLHVDYRNVTPIDRELHVEGHVVERDGRKVLATGQLRDGPRVCADVRALFVTLRPGQP